MGLGLEPKEGLMQILVGLEDDLAASKFLLGAG